MCSCLLLLLLPPILCNGRSVYPGHVSEVKLCGARALPHAKMSTTLFVLLAQCLLDTD
jgi:hypothetical protein